MRREIGDRVFAALFGDEPAAEGREALFGDGAGLVEDAFLEPGEARLDQRDLARHKGGDQQERLACRREVRGPGDSGFRHGERDDLDRRDHLARFDDSKGGQGPEGHRLIHQVEAVEPVAVEDEKAARLGKQIGAAGKGIGDGDVGPRRGGRDAGGGLVLPQIAGFEPCHDDMRQAGRSDRVEIGARQHAAFLQGGRAELQAVREDRPFRLGYWHLTEFHAAQRGCNDIVRP